MGMAQSTEDTKCPLPGGRFTATPLNVNTVTEQATRKKKEIKELLQKEVGGTIPVVDETTKETVTINKDGSLIKKVEEETTTTQTSLFDKEKKKEQTSLFEQNGGDKEKNEIEKLGGYHKIKKMKLSNKKLREILKSCKMKISKNGKYLTKKQLLNQIKMFKI